VIRVIERLGQRIHENRCGFIEGDTVFPLIAGGFGRVPFVDH
jgi:hypothetical protein